MGSAIAVIDVGSNTVRLLVAPAGDPAAATYTDGERFGLGQEIERDGRMSDATIQATAETVRRFARDAEQQGATKLEVFVTAPGRHANGEELVEAIERAAGLPVRVVTPEEEARLAFAGAVVVAAPQSDVVAVVDLGGASTEIAVGSPASGPTWTRSVDLGAVRLTERLLRDEQPTAEDVEAAVAVVGESFSGVTPPLPGVALVVGGSARALARVLGTRLAQGELSAAAAILPLCSADALAATYDVPRQRVPLLLATSLILAEVQRRLVVPIDVAEGGVREGALMLAGRAAPAG